MEAQFKMKTPVGDLFLVASEKGLRSILNRKSDAKLVKTLAGEDPQSKILVQAYLELTEYFSGNRQSFTVPLDIVGTEFQKTVWKQLRKIPYGQTASYKQIAERIQNAKATRAVGTANGRNPLCIIIPCHRVISSDGGLGGYSGGLPMKVGLLEIELSR